MVEGPNGSKLGSLLGSFYKAAVPRFPSNPLTIRVLSFLIFGFSIRRPPNQQGKRVLLGNLVSLNPKP